MPRNGGNSRRSGGSSGGSRGRGGVNGRSMGTSAAPNPRVPPSSSSNLPSKQHPVKQALPASGGKGQGPSAAGTFGASMAGSLAGTMLGAALFGPAGPGGVQGSAAEPQLVGECAEEFVKLVKCIETSCCDLDMCYAELDELSYCHTRRK